MKTLLTNYTFNASSQQVTFSGVIPASINQILLITNYTRGVIYFQPLAGQSFSGSLAGAVLTLNASTSGHSNSDTLQIFIDDGAQPATEATQAAILGSAGTSPPALPGGATGFQGWSRLLWQSLGLPSDAAVTDPTAAGTIPALLKGLLSSLAARVPALTVSGNSLKIIDTKTDNPWVNLRTWNTSTIPVEYNSRPSSSLFVPISDITPGTKQLEIIAKLKPTPSSSCRFFIWIDDGTEIYCVSPAGGNAGENGLSVVDSNGAFDGVAPVIVDLQRYTPTIKVAAIVLLDDAAVIFDTNNNCVNPGFTGGEAVLLSTSGILPYGLSGRIVSVDPVNDTISVVGTQLTDGALARINLTQASVNVLPYLGLSARCRVADLDTGGDWLVLDGTANINLTVKDTIRIRAASGLSTLPSLASAALTTTTTYTVIEISGNKIKISVDGTTPFNVTAFGTGIFYIFKFPYINCYVKGANQLSYTPGGPAINFIAQHTNASVVVTPGTAASVTHTAHGFNNNKELMMTGTTIPGGAFNGQRFYVKNQATNSYQLSLTPGGPAVAFTGAGAGVQMIDVATGVISTVTITAGTPGSIQLPLHWLGILNRFTLGGGTLPGEYTAGQTLWVLSPAVNTFNFSENKLTPAVFTTTGSGVTLNAGGTDWADVPIEIMSAFVANSPPPTDNTISLSYTLGGAPISLSGGVGAHSFALNPNDRRIKANSYIKVRAM